MGGRGWNETIFCSDTKAKANHAKRLPTEEEGNKPMELNSSVLFPAPAAALDTALGAAPVNIAGLEATENEQKKKKSCTNWAKGDYHIKMEKAIHDWNKNVGTTLCITIILNIFSPLISKFAFLSIKLL